MGRLVLISVLLGIVAAAVLRPDAQAHPTPPPEASHADSDGGTPTSPDLRPVTAQAAPERVEDNPPPPPEFPFLLPREFGPGPVIHGRVISETGRPLQGLTVRTTTWRPDGRGCFKPTYRLGRTEVREDGTFTFHVDAEMLRSMPERKGSTPFSIEADGHLTPRVELSADLWAALKAGIDIRWMEFQLRLAAVIEVRVLDERGRPCDDAEVYRSEDSTNDRWNYQGRAEEGIWRAAKTTPGPGGHWSARFGDLVSSRTPLSGPVTAGETSTVELRLVRRRPATLTVILGNYRPGLRAELDGEEIRLDGPVTTLETLTGPHSLSISGDAPWTWKHSSFEIPRMCSSHTFELVLPK